MKIKKDLRVLVVDDDLAIMQLQAAALTVVGCSVFTAAGPIEALNAIAAAGRRMFDIAVLDYQMPVMNGSLLASCLRLMNSDLKIILYSGSVDIPQSDVARADAYVCKSEGPHKLINTMTSLTS